MNYNGVEITVEENGKFTAVVNGRERTLANLAALKKEIDGAGAPVKALYLARSYWSRVPRPEVVEVIAFLERDNKFKLSDGRKIDHYEIYHFDQAVFEQAANFYSQQIKLEKEFEALRGSKQSMTGADLIRARLEIKTSVEHN